MDNPVMKSGKLLAEFVMYCAAHPDLRFYQALSGVVRVQALGY